MLKKKKKPFSTLLKVALFYLILRTKEIINKSLKKKNAFKENISNFFLGILVF